jgi:hypothetical protein
MLIQTMNVYIWPVSFLREMERWIKKFIWSGDISKRKMVNVVWKKVCTDYVRVRIDHAARQEPMAPSNSFNKWVNHELFKKPNLNKLGLGL